MQEAVNQGDDSEEGGEGPMAAEKSEQFGVTLSAFNQP